MKFWNLTRSKVRIFFHGLSRITLFIGAILMTAAVIWLAIQIFQGDVDLDPDFPPSITKPEDKESGGNITEENPPQRDNGDQDPAQSGSPAIPGRAAPTESSRGTPSAPNPAAPSQPSQPQPGSGSDAPDPILPIFPVNPPPLLDPILDPLDPVTDPLLKSGPLGPVLQ